MAQPSGPELLGPGQSGLGPSGPPTLKQLLKKLFKKVEKFLPFTDIVEDNIGS